MVMRESTPTLAQQFSADILRTSSDQVAISGAGASGKVYVSNAKVRIETSDFPGDFFLIDGEKGSAYLVRPSGRIFMEAKQSSPLTRLLVGVGPGDPCRQWQSMAKIAGMSEQGDPWQCERIGQEQIGDRATTGYRAHAPGRDLVGWIDADLKFPLKIQEGETVAVVLANVHESSQPASLFEIPSNFRKFDPRDLIERIKHSDVWVEAPGAR
jgi:hypothetical protein